MADKKYTHVPVRPKTHDKIKKLQKRMNKKAVGTITIADTLDIVVSEKLEEK